MSRKFDRILYPSQSKYKVYEKDDSNNQQSSYNLNSEIESYLLNHNLIVKKNDGGSNDEIDYVTNEGVEIILGKNIINVIGNKFDNLNNKIIFTHTFTKNTEKFQLKRRKFKQMNDPSYNWFVRLYDLGVENSNFTTLVDDENKKIYFDLEFNEQMFKYDSPEASNTNFPYSQNLNIILYGAPGTGKTYNTFAYALAIVKKCSIEEIYNNYSVREELVKEYRNFHKNIKFVTFHQNYSYEEFIEGLRPIVEKNKDGSMKFDYKDGIFKKICDDARKDKDNNYVLIIDEINRANISKVFGELISLIEFDKREKQINELKIELASGKDFSVPLNVYILGTMNSADKSISLIDAALRRRFKFIEIEPNENLIKDEFLKTFFIKINNRLYEELKSTDLLIGHSYFIDKNIDDFVEIMNDHIIPLLYEYFLDNRDEIKKNLIATIDQEKFKVDDSNKRRLKISKV